MEIIKTDELQTTIRYTVECTNFSTAIEKVFNNIFMGIDSEYGNLGKELQKLKDEGYYYSNCSFLISNEYTKEVSATNSLGLLHYILTFDIIYSKPIRFFNYSTQKGF